MADAKKNLVLVCALPPPHHGMTVYYEALLLSGFAGAFTIRHIDTSDRRNLDNIGALDLRNMYLGIRNLVELAWVCVRWLPDTVYVPNAQNTLGFLRDGLFILTAAFLSRAKIVMHFHGGDSFADFRRGSGPIMRWFVGRVLRRVDLAIVLGERLKYLFANDVKSVEVVPNGIMLQALPYSGPRAENRVVTLSFLGTLLFSKGVLDLLNAAVLLKQRDCAFELRFAGDWWEQELQTRDAALRLVNDAHLNGSVRFLGRLAGAEKEAFLSSTDIFILPTQNDGFPLVILEAMAAGCPVISTKDIGAIPEVVIEGVTGTLVEKQNPAQLAEAIARLIDDRDLRKSMGEAGRKRFEEYYTFDKCAARLTEVLQKILE